MPRRGEGGEEWQGGPLWSPARSPHGPRPFAQKVAFAHKVRNLHIMSIAKEADIGSY